MPVKKFIKTTLMLLLFAASLPTYAQQPMSKRTAEERADRQTQWMQRNLGLTEEQNKKVYAILLYHATKTDDVSNMPPSGEKQAEKHEIKRDKEADLRAVLTGRQYEIYRQHEEEKKEKRQQQRANNRY